MTALATEAITHRGWLAACEAKQEVLAAIYGVLDTMAAHIAKDDGDRGQIAEIRAAQANIKDLQDEGEKLVDTVNATQVPVGEAYAGAGGTDNAPDKDYAAEARSGGEIWDLGTS